MLESVAKSNPTEPKVGDTPEVIGSISSTLQSKIGIQPSDLKNSPTLRIVHGIAASINKATVAIQENSQLVTDAITKDQRILFTSFLRGLRQISEQGEGALVKNQDKFLTRLATLEVSLSRSQRDHPDNPNLQILQNMVQEIRKQFVPKNTGGTFWRAVKGELFTLPKAEHFNEGFFKRAFFGGRGDAYERRLKALERAQSVADMLRDTEGALSIQYDQEKGRYRDKPVGDNKKPIQRKDFTGLKLIKPERAKPVAKTENVPEVRAKIQPDATIAANAQKALQKLGLGAQDAKARVLEAMEQGATDIQEIIKIAVKDLDRTEQKSYRVEQVHSTVEPLTHTEAPSIQQAVAMPEPRIKYNELYEGEESPYRDEEDRSPYRDEPVRAKIEPELRNRKGQFVRGHKQPLLNRDKQGRFVKQEQKLVEETKEELKKEEPDAIANISNEPLEKDGPEHIVPVGGQQQQTPQTVELLKDIKELVQDIDKKSDEKEDSGTVIGTIAKAVGGMLSAGAVGAMLEAALPILGIGALVGAGAYAVHRFNNKRDEQKELDNKADEAKQDADWSKKALAIKSGKIPLTPQLEKEMQEGWDKGYVQFDWHPASQLAKSTTTKAQVVQQATQAAQPEPTPTVQPAPIYMNQPNTPQIVKDTVVLPGVRSTENTFLRFLDKRWVR